ncbi:unnamed protein product [Cochlearia groenlandica]
MSEKSTFSRRCSLLSRYLKEKGSFGNIDIGLALKSDLELVGKSNSRDQQNLIKKAENSETRSFELFPNLIIGEASTSSGDKAKDVNLSKSNVVIPDLNEPTSSKNDDDNYDQQPKEQHQVVERIARRASLHRFFAKRKDRAVARAPYQVNQNVSHLPPKPHMTGPLVEPRQSSRQPMSPPKPKET